MILCAFRWRRRVEVDIPVRTYRTENDRKEKQSAQNNEKNLTALSTPFQQNI